MGIFGDIFREVVSEIGNVVIEEISKEFNQNNYDEQRVQELKVSMDNYSLLYAFLLSPFCLKNFRKGIDM